ncbi:MAG: metal-sensitive transcriptional regulator [Actinomycetota bacterium]
MAEPAAAATDAPAPREERLLVRLRRAEGQLRGVQRMIAEGAPVEDVLTQMAAVKAAVDQVGLQLIGERLRTCAQAGEEGCGEDLDRALATLLRFAALAR